MCKIFKDWINPVYFSIDSMGRIQVRFLMFNTYTIFYIQYFLYIVNPPKAFHYLEIINLLMEGMIRLEIRDFECRVFLKVNIIILCSIRSD